MLLAGDLVPAGTTLVTHDLGSSATQMSFEIPINQLDRYQLKLIPYVKKSSFLKEKCA